MSAVLALPSRDSPRERKCKIEEVFDQNFIELIGMVPRNPYIRALILKLTGKMPGQECGTLEQIKDWVETNCEKRSRASFLNREVRRDGISINVEFSETEYGRANYSVRRYGSESFSISAEDLIGMIQGALDDGEGIDRIVEVIAEKIDDDAWNQCDPSMDSYGDYDYDEHDANDSGDSETDYSKDTIRNAVLAFVRERHPELAAEL